MHVAAHRQASRTFYGRRTSGWLVAGWLVAVSIGAAAAHDPQLAAARRAAPGDDDEPPAGLAARYEAPGAPPILRVDSRIALHGRWSAVDRRLPDDAGVKATWTGRVKVQTPGAHQLLVHGQGTVVVKLDGRAAIDATLDEIGWRKSETLELEFGEHALEVSYVGGEKGAHLALFWHHAQFGLEPIAPRFFTHDFDPRGDDDAFARGETLVRSLRCAGCHAIPGETLLAAPALDRLTGSLDRGWLVERLTDAGEDELVGRRMPHVALPRDEAEALAAFLLAPKNVPPPFKPDDQQPFPPPESPAAAPAGKSNAKSKPAPRKGPNAQAGERIAWTVGCVACHVLDDEHQPGPFDGGDLRHIGRKRPAAFFSRWLADPSSLNSDRRMPEFELTGEEREDLAAYLATLGAGERGDKSAPREPSKSAEAPKSQEATPSDEATLAKGRELFLSRRCAACHRGPGFLAAQPAGRAGPLGAESRWETSCLGAPAPEKQRPGYRLSAADGAAIRAFATTLEATGGARRRQPHGESLLRERGCTNCHGRDFEPGLAARLPDVARRFDSLAPLVPAMTPPSLTSVGDKLHDPALAGAVTRLSGARRPYLLVRMPRFRISSAETDAIVFALGTADRVPEDAPTPPIGGTPDSLGALPDGLLRSAGGRLVTPDGFGCTSCHAVGKVEPPPGPLAARGPSLSKLENRVRRSWFDRFVRNPVRIIPRMEMPTVQLPVRGVLDDRLDRQLDAVWRTLNLPDFEPPEPNPIQTLRRTGIAADGEPAAIVTDLVLVGGRMHVKPLLIGLPNRHNVLFDFETNRLTRWSIGDVARQRAKGKGWHWEAAGVDLLRNERTDGEIAASVDGKSLAALTLGQFPTEPDAWRHLPGGGVELAYRLHFGARDGGERRTVRVKQRWTPVWPAEGSAESGFDREIVVEGAPREMALRWRAIYPEQASTEALDDARREYKSPGGETRWRLTADGATLAADGSAIFPPDARDPHVRRLTIAYRATSPVDRFPAVPPPAGPPFVPAKLDRVPGFEAVRLPLPPDQMPTALAWRPSGELAVASLKGRVWLARDTNGDGLEDRLTAFSDELAAPYGLAAPGDALDGALDVATKFGVVRLYDADGDGRAERSEVVASGWGHTDDYHDWTIGLPRDADGAYYVGLACQQDKRSDAAAALRGTVLKLIPRAPTPDSPRRYDLQVLSGGHRFPMGLARSAAGDLFVTDNQGNYNPFNELNHVRPGLRFGFINANERKPGFQPAWDEPAINIPHPWTRSVNGVAFLETPAAAREKLGGSAFGPFEGQLVGCEYDTRRLVRLSVQRVGDTFQGAAYPLSRSSEDATRDFLGPICAAVSPTGELYVGGLRDSGWGAGNNIGELVRLRFDAAQLPAGIAEATTDAGKIRLRFTRAVGRERAGRVENYSLASYRRETTPAYGGPDLDRRTETVRAVTVADDGTSATLDVGELRGGFVYEIRLKSLVADGEFFPDEAHLTVRAGAK